MNNDDPIAFFLTWVTYGTWLPGDERGWVEFKRGWKLPEPVRELEANAKMTEDTCKLDRIQRRSVETQIDETCRYCGWHLHAVNCRSNHIHVVVTARDTAPKKVRVGLKAWATRRLTQFNSQRKHWWAERGSIRWIFDEDSLEAAVTYTLEAQDHKHSQRQPEA